MIFILIVASLLSSLFGSAFHPRSFSSLYDPASANTSYTPYTPAQIRKAYGFNDKVKGQGQTIAIVVAYGSKTIQEDLNVFCQTFALPSTTIEIDYPDGVPTEDGGTWALETALDVEWAHAIAPEAKLLLVVAKDNYLNAMSHAVERAVALGANIVSMSWGGSEWSRESSVEYLFNYPGITFVAASGDDGAGVGWPAISPKVLAVGGTALYLNADGTIRSEKAWRGSGGGVSRYFSKPKYQKKYQTTRKRTNPDVSYNAAPQTGVWTYSAGSWYSMGGTSAGAPQWAGLIALVNEKKGGALRNANTQLYRLANKSHRPRCYRDIVSGNNGKYRTKKGYDAVTGLGSPRAQKIISSLSAK